MTTGGGKRWLTTALIGAALATGGQAFAAITSMNTTNDSTTITYEFQYGAAGGHYHAYIDCDRKFTTGYQTTYGVGAEYLIEDGTFYKWSGSGFNWVPAGTVTYTPPANNTVAWKYPRSNLSTFLGVTCDATAANVAFEVTHPGGTNEVSMLLTHTYLASSSGLTNDITTNDASNVTYRVQFSGTWAYYHVFIDTDENPSTGFPIGGIGADYLAENGSLYVHTAGTTGWDWQTPPTPVTFSASNGIASWTVPRSAMGETQADERADIVYHVQDSTNTVTVTLPKRTDYYFGGTGLPKPLPAQALVPLYVRPDHGTAWANVLTAHQSNPSTPITVIVNPATGPGTVTDPVYATAITNLRNNGIHVAGYVNTSRGGRAAGAVDGDVDSWKMLYPNVDGIFYDLMAVTLTNCAGSIPCDTYYQQRTSHAKFDGFGYTIGNPGQDVPPPFVGTVDTLVVYEHNGDSTPMSSWWASYPRNGFAVIPYNVPTLDATFISSAKQRVGYIYLTNETDDNYNQLSGYFSSLLGQLALAPPP
jgi:Spherulation-specific family 4